MSTSANTLAKAAQRLATKDVAALEVQIGLRQIALEHDPNLKDNLGWDPKYDDTMMGSLDEVRALGRRVLRVWNKALHDLVCGQEAADTQQRQAIFNALNIGESAVIGVIAGALISVSAPAVLAAALPPLIVK